MSRYSKNLEYDMREEATPWPSSALAAPTLPKAGSAATLAARALQKQIVCSNTTCARQHIHAYCYQLQQSATVICPSSRLQQISAAC